MHIVTSRTIGMQYTQKQTGNKCQLSSSACTCNFLLSIAIPDSIFVEESTLRDKTMKAASVARSASIFGISRIYLYRDGSRNFEGDYETARLILQYAETPQYLRKALFPKNPDLEYAGLIPPLRTPHHVTNPQPKLGEIREAVLIMQNGTVLADVGARELALYEGKGKQPRDRVTVRVESIKPLSVSLSEKPENAYWGYEVRRAPSLSRFLKSAKFDLIIFTTRKGDLINKKWTEISQRLSSSQRTCVCFGSPASGVDAMLSQDSASFDDFFPKALVLNTFPSQNVETVRLEEAILGSLCILNIANRL